jgi:hypothetical protein
VEIKCQLDATDVFLLQILLLAQHVSGTIMPIFRSSRVLYRWLLPVVFGALVLNLSVWCGAEGCVRFAGCCSPQTGQCLKHVEQAIRSAIKTSVASSWHFISTDYTSYALMSLGSHGKKRDDSRKAKPLEGSDHYKKAGEKTFVFRNEANRVLHDFINATNKTKWLIVIA